jgi:hypothetical protein
MFEKSIFFILVSSHRRVYHKKGVSALSEKEKRIVEKLKDAIPNMSEFDKGYILGKTESFSEKKDDSDKAQKESS